MSWRPLTDILPTVDAGAQRAAIVATGGTPPQVPAPAPAAVPSIDRPAPTQLFSPGLSAAERAQRDAEAQAQAAAQEAERRSAYEEGMALARAEGEALALRYRAALEDLVTAREQVIKASEADLVRLALTIAREVLMADVPGREQFTQRMAEQALILLQTSPAVTLRLGPKDAASLRQHKPELLRRDDVSVVEDETLEAGGVIAEGSKGRVDASLEARLRAMATKLLPAGEVTP